MRGRVRPYGRLTRLERPGGRARRASRAAGLGSEAGGTSSPAWRKPRLRPRYKAAAVAARARVWACPPRRAPADGGSTRSGAPARGPGARLPLTCGGRRGGGAGPWLRPSAPADTNRPRSRRSPHATTFRGRVPGTPQRRARKRPECQASPLRRQH
ncbi:putative uncharacterized protein WWC2-AS2 [Sciurus carolinensis]|uniref:putative uncharacterized protein WWC2-AS2 n=1 Tax=Sciurus carolinensis TaxID=30640 RepID=UPI001FB33607|nr:putative uncharacterized protein WWC2-AS2 [Sciurus carolinensis]